MDNGGEDINMYIYASYVYTYINKNYVQLFRGHPCFYSGLQLDRLTREALFLGSVPSSHALLLPASSIRRIAYVVAARTSVSLGECHAVSSMKAADNSSLTAVVVESLASAHHGIELAFKRGA